LRIKAKGGSAALGDDAQAIVGEGTEAVGSSLDEFSGGSGTPVFTFKQDGEKLAGHYRGAFGEAEVTGTITGSAIKFSIKIAGQDDLVSYTGTVDGDSMKGSIVLGSYGDGTFTGKKEAKK
jgi:hypothetical protein